MSLTGLSLPRDTTVASAAAAALGCGAVLALHGVAALDTRIAALGGATAALALIVLLAGSWLNGLILIAFAVPLPALYSSADVRLAAALPVTAVVLIAWVLQRFASREAMLLGALPRRTVASLFGAFLVAAVLSENPLVSARELLNVGLLLGLLVAATDTLSRDARASARVATVLVAAAAVCGLLAVLETLDLIPGSFPHHGVPLNRAALGFGQPNGLGLFLALVLPLAVHQFTRSGAGMYRMLSASAVVLVTLGLLGTFSRGSWSAVLLGTLPLLFTGDRRFVARVWACGLVLALVFDVASGGAIRDTIARSVGDWSVQQRAALMHAGMLTFLANPVLGVGPGGFAQSLDRFGLLVPQLDDWQPTPHNAYIQVAAETGVVGLVAFVVFLAVVMRLLIRGVRAHGSRCDTPTGTAYERPAIERGLQRAVLWSFGVLCIAALFDWPFPHGAGQVAMLVMAMGCARLRSAPG